MDYTKEQVEAAVLNIKERSHAYKQCFGSEWGKRVLADLILFCRGFETPCDPDSVNRTYMLLGRHEVFTKIAREMNLTPTQLATIYTGGKITLIDETPTPENEEEDDD